MVIQRLDSRTQGTVGHCCPLAMNRMVWRMVQRYLVGLMEGVQTDNRVLIEMFVGLHRMRYRHQAGRSCAMMVRYGRLGRLTHGRQQNPALDGPNELPDGASECDEPLDDGTNDAPDAGDAS